MRHEMSPSSPLPHQEPDFLGLLIAELAKKVGWGDPTQWNSSQLRILEEQIETLTRIRISEYTLRRIIHRQVANPQMATRNALARFVGYESWYLFTQWANEVRRERDVTEKAPTIKSAWMDSPHSDTPEERQSGKEEAAPFLSADKGTLLRRIPTVGWIVIGVLLAVIVWPWLVPGRFKLLAAHETNTPPLEVKFSWQYPFWVTDSLFLEIDSYNEKNRFALPASKGTMQYTFMIPASSEVRLVYKNRVRKRMRIRVASKDWVIVTKTAANYWFFLDKDPLFLEEGALRFPPRLAREYNLSPLNPSIHYRYIGANLANGNRFRFEAEVRNSRSDGAVPCYDMEVALYARNGMFRAGINAGACSSQLRVVASENEVRGEFSDLSVLSAINPDNWQHLTMEARDKTLRFSVNGEELFSLPYQEPLDSIYGFDIRCKGFGRVSRVALFDKGNELLYQENFGEEAHEQ